MLKVALKIIFFCFFTSICCYTVKADGWNGISVFVNNREEVEKKFGRGVAISDNKVLYEFQKYTIKIEYTTGKCAEDSVDEWKVKENLVKRIKVIPKTTIVFNRKNFEHYDKVARIGQSDESKIYLNNKKGKAYTLRQENKTFFVEEIVFFPGEEFDHLVCIIQAERNIIPCGNREIWIEEAKDSDAVGVVNLFAVTANTSKFTPVYDWEVIGGGLIGANNRASIKVDTKNSIDDEIKIKLKYKAILNNRLSCYSEIFYTLKKPQ